MVKAVSFDFYGVLYSNFDWGVINDRIYPDEKKETEFRGLVDSANDGEIGNDEFRRKVGELAEDATHSDKPAVHFDPLINTKLIDYIKRLKTDTDLKLAILSNGSRVHVCEVLEQYNAVETFDLIATSAELPNYKPEAGSYYYVADELGVPREEYLHIDDSPRHIEGAQAAGVQSILYVDEASLEEQLAQLLVR